MITTNIMIDTKMINIFAILSFLIQDKIWIISIFLNFRKIFQPEVDFCFLGDSLPFLATTILHLHLRPQISFSIMHSFVEKIGYRLARALAQICIPSPFFFLAMNNPHVMTTKPS